MLIKLLITCLFFVGFLWSSAYIAFTSFEKAPTGTPYEENAWKMDGFSPAWTQTLEKNSAVDEAHAHEGQKSLKVTYPEGTVGPAENGGQAKLLLEPKAEYYASYYLRFSENFSWGGRHEGGKLPGLAAGDNCSGGMTCDGVNGFSARYMWRQGGRAVLYLYHMDKANKWGDDRELTFADGKPVIFPKNEWIHLVQRVKVNTVKDGLAQKDGEVQVWFNGQEVLNLDNIRFVSNKSKVDNMYFSTFHGGNTADWAPRETCWIWFDELKISDKKEDVL